jgi:hypothetical protein
MSSGGTWTAQADGAGWILVSDKIKLIQKVSRQTGAMGA